MANNKKDITTIISNWLRVIRESAYTIYFVCAMIVAIPFTCSKCPTSTQPPPTPLQNNCTSPQAMRSDDDKRVNRKLQDWWKSQEMDGIPSLCQELSPLPIKVEICLSSGKTVDNGDTLGDFLKISAGRPNLPMINVLEVKRDLQNRIDTLIITQ